MTQSLMHKAAQWYAGRLGWAVFPLAERGKVPAIGKADGGRGCIDATSDPDQVDTWWGAMPNANIGIGCGEASGAWVLDIDSDKGGDESLSELEKAHGALPATPTVQTGSGGRHLYFSLPDGVTVRNRAGVWKGIDTRSDHGYVVAPPSIHPNGTPYRWLSKPTDVLLAEAPAWLVRAVSGQPERAVEPSRPVSLPADRVVDRARSYVARMPASVSGEGGHQKLWAAALVLVCGFDLPARTALDVLWAEFNQRCRPPWSQRELEHKIHDAGNARIARGYMLEDEPSAVPVDSFFLGQRFREHGWIGGEHRPGAWLARCPSEALHRGGDRFDGSTLVLAPNAAGKPGFFLCTHPECSSIYRSADMAVKAMARVARAEGL